jgi:hypothetical protein
MQWIAPKKEFPWPKLVASGVAQVQSAYLDGGNQNHPHQGISPERGIRYLIGKRISGALTPCATDKPADMMLSGWPDYSFHVVAAGAPR